jgi:hypothetical protein
VRWCWNALVSWSWTGSVPPGSDSLIADKPPGLTGRTGMVNLRSSLMPFKTMTRSAESAFCSALIPTDDYFLCVLLRSFACGRRQSLPHQAEAWLARFAVGSELARGA